MSYAPSIKKLLSGNEETIVTNRRGVGVRQQIGTDWRANAIPVHVMKTINQPIVTKWDQFNQANLRFRQQIMKQLPTSQMPAIPALQHQTGATMIYGKMRNFKK
jgi:hypothetical protein